MFRLSPQLLLIPLFTLLFFRPINILTADLGRHIKNGEVFFTKHEIVKTNYYSYTQPDLPTINHHWGAGVIFYSIYKIFGFVGVHLFFGILGGLTLYFVYKTVRLHSGFWFSLVAVLLVVPFVRLRLEVRPEMISYLFISIYIYLYEKFKLKQIQLKHLFLILLPIQVVWVNVHIFFIFGIFISLVYLRNWKGLLFAALSLLNPFGLVGLLEPLNIFKEYGYTIVENKSVFFMQNRLPKFEYIYFEFMFLVYLVLAYYGLIETRSKKQLSLIVIVLAFGVLGFVMNRNIILFGLALPALFTVFHNSVSVHVLKLLTVSLSIIIVLDCVKYYGVGVREELLGSGEFYMRNGISGPVFNNYDIGGYLVFTGIPVFVDNRPEAYTVDFLQNVYVRAQEDEPTWNSLDEKYGFETIYFYRLDATPWAQPFLIRRIQDPNWAPVFVDGGTIILLKRDDQNKALIEQFEIPQEYFKIQS